MPQCGQQCHNTVKDTGMKMTGDNADKEDAGNNAVMQTMGNNTDNSATDVDAMMQTTK
jgi:hypothetical protein